MAEAREPALGGDEVRRGERVVAVSRPIGVGRARILAGPRGVPVPAEVDGVRREAAFERIGDRQVGVAVEAGGV